MFLLVSKMHAWVVVSGDVTLEKSSDNIGGRYISKAQQLQNRS